MSDPQLIEVTVERVVEGIALTIDGATYVLPVPDARDLAAMLLAEAGDAFYVQRALRGGAR